MSSNQSLDIANDAFTCRTDGSVAILRLGQKAFELNTDLDMKGRLLTLLSEIEQSSELKVLLVINSSDYAGFSAYREFLPIVSGKDADLPFDRRQLLAREENALGQFAITAASFNKLTVAALQGDITTSFFGMCLAFDYRFAAKGMRIVSPYADTGAPPVGAFGFCLPRYVSQGKIPDLLLSGEPIPADRVLELGLVNELCDVDTYKQNSLEKCKNLCQHSTQTIKGIRQLIHTEVGELEQYMKHSNEIMTTWAGTVGR